MPVTLGKNLNINNNRLESYSKSVYEKLNKAKAWTKTDITESGGTVSVIMNTDELVTNMETGINDWYIPTSAHYLNYAIIDNKLYKKSGSSLSQFGEKTDWKMCSSTPCAIDSQNKLYRINSTSGAATEIGEGINWTYVTSSMSFDNEYAIGDSKLYKINSNNNTITQIGTETGWTKLSYFYWGSGFGYGICNGSVYYITSSGATPLSSDNNFVDISSAGDSYILYALNNLHEAFYVNSSRTQLVKIDAQFDSPIKQIVDTSEENYAVITNDGQLICGSISDKTQYKLDPTIFWSYTCGGISNSSYMYAIGDGKLYRIINPTRPSDRKYTQIGTIDTYTKVSGALGTTTSTLLLAWTGEATYLDHTVYTTKSPQAGDRTYSDNELTPYSTIVSVSGTTITDEYRTYDVDIAKDSSFTSIPPAATHETVGTIELLNALNPNN